MKWNKENKIELYRIRWFLRRRRTNERDVYSLHGKQKKNNERATAELFAGVAVRLLSC